MGNIFGKCIPKKKPKPQSYRLKDYSNNPSSGNKTGGEKKSGAVKGRVSGGQTLGGNGKTMETTGDKNGGPSREDMAAAAQRRHEEARSKGLQNGGGKISRKLEEQQKNKNKPDLTPSNTPLHWTVDS